MKDNWWKWLLAGIAAYLVFKNPAGSAAFVNAVFHSLTTFLSKI